jgi:hypothetical protein
MLLSKMLPELVEGLRGIHWKSLRGADNPCVRSEQDNSTEINIEDIEGRLFINDIT